MSGSEVLCLTCLKRLEHGQLVMATPEADGSPSGEAFELPWDGAEIATPGAKGNGGFWRELWRSLFATGDTRDQSQLPLDDVRCLCEGRARDPFVGLRLDRLPPSAIGVVGGLGVGKTHLLVSMAHHLRLSPERHSLAAIGPRHDWLAEQEDRFLRRGERLHPTPPGSAPERRQAWRIQDRRNRQRPRSVGLLLTDDRSGEIWEGKAVGADEALANYVALLSSVLFVVNGAAIGAYLGIDTTDAWSQTPVQPDAGSADDHILDRLLEKIGPRRAGQMPCALLVSRFDSLWGHDREDLEGADAPFFDADPGAQQAILERLLQTSGRSGLLDRARESFAEVRLFAATVLGYRPGPGDLENGRLRRLPEPAGVVEPLRWLLESIRL